MIKKSITYVDYNGKTRTEDFWFNLNQSECVEMEMSVNGGLSVMMQRLMETDDNAKIMPIIKDVLLKTYGEKSADGKHFNKSPEITAAFANTRAYSVLFMELATDAKAAADFFNGVVDNVDAAVPAVAEN